MMSKNLVNKSTVKLYKIYHLYKLYHLYNIYI